MKEISDVVGKYLEIDPAISLGTHAGHPRLVGDPVNDRFHLLLETYPQAGFNRFVAADGIGKLSRGLLQEAGGSCWVEFVELGEKIGNRTGFGGAVS